MNLRGPRRQDEQKAPEPGAEERHPAPEDHLAFLGKLASDLSHDMRSPLGAISNAAYYLELKHGAGDEKSREHFRVIKSEIAKLDGIIRYMVESLTRPPEQGSQ